MAQPDARRLPAPSSHRDLAESRLRALTEIGRAAMTSSPHDALEAVVRSARAAMGGVSASLGVWEPDAQHLRTVINEGALADWEEKHPTNETYPADQSTWLAGMADGHLGVVLDEDDPLLPDDDREFLESLGKARSISLPILLAGEWWGELFVARTGDQPRFTDGDLDWGAAVAAQVGAALEAVEHLGRVSGLARTDPLTGLANRLGVDEWIDHALVQWRDHRVAVGLVVCDLNGLKKVNDSDGHDAGDRLLVSFATQLNATAERFGASLVARLGGDEFMLGFSGAQTDVVVSAAERLTERGWDVLPEGVACGVAVTGGESGPVETAARLFRLADAAQYRAKRTRSRRPIVAGRALPDDAKAALIPDDELAPDRRLVRAEGRRDAAHLVESGLRALDQVADESVRTRLALVGDVVAHYVDAVGWWLSIAPADQPTIRTVEFALVRQLPGLSADELAAEVGGVFPVDAFPLSAVALGGQAFVVRADDPTADPSELTVLDGLSASAVVGAGGADEEGDRWLLELFTDSLSGSVRELPPLLRVLVLAALHPPVPPAR
ncbi:MAG: GGDEF domain-containing protein [Actinomycetes bacterium]